MCNYTYRNGHVEELTEEEKQQILSTIQII